jgi:hypothetical protein
MPDIALSKRLEMVMRGTRNFMVGNRGRARAFELLVLQLLRLFFWQRRGCQGLLIGESAVLLFSFLFSFLWLGYNDTLDRFRKFILVSRLLLLFHFL